jgi:hypothetical protein
LFRLTLGQVEGRIRPRAAYPHPVVYRNAFIFSFSLHDDKFHLEEAKIAVDSPSSEKLEAKLT